MRGALKGIRKQTAHTGPGHRLSGCLSIICGTGSLQILLPRPRLGRNPGYAPHMHLRMTSLSFSSIKGTHYSRDWVQDNFRSLWNEASSSAASPVAYDFRHHYAIVNINSWADDGFGFSDKLHYLSNPWGIAP